MRRLGIVAVLAGCGRFGFTDHASDARAIDADMRVVYRAGVLADHPVAYWRLGDVGLVARDELGQLDGTYAGGVMLGQTGAVTADADGAARFDGLTGQVNGPDVLPFSGIMPYSLEAWVNEPSTARYQHYVTKETRVAPGPIDGYALLQGPGTDVYTERCIAQTCSIAGNLAIAADTWTHLVATYDGSSLALYIDGEPRDASADARAMAAYSTPLLLGAHINGANLDGTLDEVAIYDHALAPDRIALHHRIGVSGPQ
jgi:hypothetical protein